MRQNVTVKNRAEFYQALKNAVPGTRILLAPGEYPGGFYAENLRGKPDAPIVIEAEDATRPPRIIGGNTGLNLAGTAYLTVANLSIEGSRDNGVNVNDGGKLSTPAMRIVLKNLTVRSVGDKGNQDGIKLSGVDRFEVIGCRIEKCSSGGSGIDMVGCHEGVIRDCVLDSPGTSGVQMKGGTRQITVRGCTLSGWQRGTNIGGSTGLPYFRPQGATYEAKDILVEECRFRDCQAPVAFVGVDGAVVRRCRLEPALRWALRILQETRESPFVRCRNGQFLENTIRFRSEQWAEGGVNIGPETLPQTFRFARNHWYCEDAPEKSRPRLPTPETEGIYGKPIE